MIAKCPNKGRRDITILTKLRFLKFKALRDKCNKMIRHLTNDHFILGAIYKTYRRRNLESVRYLIFSKKMSLHIP